MTSADELAQLRKRVKAQRAELRRLNQQMTYFWHGWAHRDHIESELRYRKKMIDAFGVDAVCEAEKRR